MKYDDELERMIYSYSRIFDTPDENGMSYSYYSMIADALYVAQEYDKPLSDAALLGQLDELLHDRPLDARSYSLVYDFYVDIGFTSAVPVLLEYGKQHGYIASTDDDIKRRFAL